MKTCPNCLGRLKGHPTLIGFDVAFYCCGSCKKNWSESSGSVLQQLGDFILGRQPILEEVDDMGHVVAQKGRLSAKGLIMRKAVFWVVWIFYVALCSGLILFGLGYHLFVRFSNPELTETQLFIRCWWAYLMMLVGALWGSAFISEEKPWQS
jgi:hypothetical protein